MNWKTVVALIATSLTAIAALWLWRNLPGYAWAEFDGDNWQIVAKGWGVLAAAWPVALAGALIGFFGAGSLLAWVLERAVDADKAEKLAEAAERVRDAEERAREAQQAAERHVQARLEAVARREAAALQAQAEAERAKVEAVQERNRAEELVQHATYRARNAICAAERIKRRAEGKQRLNVQRN